MRPLYNQRVGRWEVDAIWPAARLAVELDSVAFHSHPTQIRRDLRKGLELAEAGWQLLRLGWREVVDEPERTAATIEARTGIARIPAAP